MVFSWKFSQAQCGIGDKNENVVRRGQDIPADSGLLQILGPCLRSWPITISPSGLLWHQLCTLKRPITELSGKLPSHDVMTAPLYFTSKVQEATWLWACLSGGALQLSWEKTMILLLGCPTSVTAEYFLESGDGEGQLVNRSIHHEKWHRLIHKISMEDVAKLEDGYFQSHPWQ